MLYKTRHYRLKLPYITSKIPLIWLADLSKLSVILTYKICLVLKATVQTEAHCFEQGSYRLMPQYTNQRYEQQTYNKYYESLQLHETFLKE